MHFCTNCQAVGWEKRIKDDLKHSKRGGNVKTNCPYCTYVGGARVVLPHPAHSMCDVCAKARNECQACGASTLTTLDQASQEAFETLVALDVGLVDSAQADQPYHYRLKRPIWTKVWGPLGFSSRPPRCGDCPPPPRNAPAMVRAAQCGHWTAGHEAPWCLPCAVERRVCACCETSTE